jgi:hypothetical protein
MYYIERTIDYLQDARGSAPRTLPPTRNRIDADPKLIAYHETGRGPKPGPDKTDFLPVRTRIIADPFSEIAKAQSEAYYEEIDFIPAAAVGELSKFGAGHWYVVHPVTYWQVRDMSNKVLLDLKEWIETTCPNALFTRRAKQVLGLKTARMETVHEMDMELERRREKGEVGLEPGYTGDWELVDAHGKDEDRQMRRVEEKEEAQVKRRPPNKSRHSEAGLELAREAGRKAAEDAKDHDDYDFAE